MPPHRRRCGRTGACGQRSHRTQPEGDRRRVPARCLHLRHRCQRLGQEHTGQRDTIQGAAKKALLVQDSPGAPPRNRGRPSEIDKVVNIDQSPIGGPRDRTRQPTPRSSTASGPFSPARLRRRSAVTSQGGSASTCPGGAARRARARAW